MCVCVCVCVFWGGYSGIGIVGISQTIVRSCVLSIQNGCKTLIHRDTVSWFWLVRNQLEPEKELIILIIPAIVLFRNRPKRTRPKLLCKTGVILWDCFGFRFFECKSLHVFWICCAESLIFSSAISRVGCWWVADEKTFTLTSSLPKANLTKPRKLLNPELSNENKRCDYSNESSRLVLSNGSVHVVSEQSPCVGNYYDWFGHRLMAVRGLINSKLCTRLFWETLL